MMAERAGIFDEELDFDVSKFKPKPLIQPSEQPSAEAVREISERAKFQSREPAPPSLAHIPARRQRRKRTGRSLQLNIKLDAQTLEAFYVLADSHSWGLGETLEKAIAALKRELDGPAI